MTLLRRIADMFAKSRARRGNTVIAGLAADSQSYVGALPAMPAGEAGHRATLDVFFSLLGQSKPAVFCDIGANKGEAGRRALALQPAMTVFGFEANPQIHGMYAAINTEAGVRWINAAVADRDGTLSLFIPRILARALEGDTLVQKTVIEAADTGKSSLLKRDENAQYDTVEVPAIALDSFLAKAAPAGRLALWIDVEGAASVVLDGARASLARTDLLIVEVEGFAFWQDQALVTQIIDRLRGQGFVPVLRDREYQDAQFNIVFLRDAPDIPAHRKAIGAAVDQASPPTPALTGRSPELLVAEVPVLVPCFNNPSYCAQMLDQLYEAGFRQITLVDNASDSPAMTAFLTATAAKVGSGITVERLTTNLGPRRSIFTPVRLANLPRWFCVTDPDLQFNPALPADFLTVLARAMADHGGAKAGFALDISAPSDLRQDTFEIGGAYYRIEEWERGFWKDRLGFTAGGDPIFKASIDTTFALYDKTNYRLDRPQRALRVGGRMTAQHLPWLARPTIDAQESAIYRASQKFSYYQGGVAGPDDTT